MQHSNQRTIATQNSRSSVSSRRCCRQYLSCTCMGELIPELKMPFQIGSQEKTTLFVSNAYVNGQLVMLLDVFTLFRDGRLWTIEVQGSSISPHLANMQDVNALGIENMAHHCNNGHKKVTWPYCFSIQKRHLIGSVIKTRLVS